MCSEGGPWEPRGLNILEGYGCVAEDCRKRCFRPTGFKVREVTRELEKLVQVQGVIEYTRGIDREVIQFS